MDYKELIEILSAQEDCVVLQYIEDAATAIETLLAERDEIIEASKGNCELCMHFDKNVTQESCVSCEFGLGMCGYWQWRGPKTSDH